MTQVSEIIRQALRESNVVSITQEITPSEVAEGLARLQNLVLSTLGNELGYIMEDWGIKSPTFVIKPSAIPLTPIQAAAYTVTPNSRLVVGLTVPTTVTLDPFPQDGQRFSVVDAMNSLDSFPLTINPNGRKLNGGVIPLEVSTEGFSQQWFYRADLADWRAIEPLAEDDDMPFPPDFDDYFIIMLAMRLNPRYGRELGSESQARLEQQRAQLIARYTQTRLRTAPQP